MTKRNPLSPPVPGPQHRALDVFVGKWHAEGTSYGEGQVQEMPYSAAVPWSSEETYAWLEGGFFLEHRWDARAGERVFKGLEIMGWDEAKGEYFTRFFDNSGYCPSYRVGRDGDTWTFTGAAQRATVVVSGAGNSMTFHWEWQQAQGPWLPLCDRTATKESITQVGQ
ncbi:MAG: DUF1579 family protein [Hymenobacter sp.]|nr:DUF1579 family protein [Hymenobacter sp.]